jgi:hypothetical protein
MFLNRTENENCIDKKTIKKQTQTCNAHNQVDSHDDSFDDEVTTGAIMGPLRMSSSCGTSPRSSCENAYPSR